MKNLSLIVFAAYTLLNSSCQKVIDIDLNKSNPQYVIEAEVTNADMPQIVHITRTVNFSDANQYPAVTNAVVTITDNVGNTDILTQEQPGYYVTTKIKGMPGNIYHLSISVDGHKFSASSKMPDPITIDTLNITEQSVFGKIVKAPSITFHEPVGFGQYYYFMVYRNHNRVKSVYIDNDQVSDGSVISRFLQDDSSYVSGDKVCVDLQSITKEMYDYYFSLQQTINQSAATPANPVTNILGGNVLGYFSAHTVDRRKVIVP